MGLLRRLVEAALRIPLLFDVQQRLCNDYRPVRREFEAHLGRTGLRLLDVGCSTAVCAAQIVDMERNSYFGLDLQPGYVAVAKRRCPAGHFSAGDARRLAFPDRIFDRVLFMSVLHHLDDDLVRAAGEEVVRVLKPDGLVLIAEPVFTPDRWLSTFLLRLDRGRFIRDPAGYRQLFPRFEVVRQGFFDHSRHRFCAFELRPPPGSR